MFEKASRLKLRISYKGLCTVEDLWDLSLEELNCIYQGVNKILKEYREESLLDKKTRDEELSELTQNIVKHIFMTKQREQKEREDEIMRAEKKQKLLGYLADKQDERYKNMTEDELSKIIDEL